MSRRAGPQAGPPRLEHVLAVGLRSLSIGTKPDDDTKPDDGDDSTPAAPSSKREAPRSPEQYKKAAKILTPLEAEIQRIPQMDARPHAVIAYYLVPRGWTHPPCDIDDIATGLRRFFYRYLRDDINRNARDFQQYEYQIRDAAIVCKQLLFFSLHSSYRQDVINHRQQKFHLHTNQTLEDLAAGMVSGSYGNLSSEFAGFWQLLRVLNYKMVRPGEGQEEIAFGTPLNQVQKPFRVARVTPYERSLHVMPPELGPAPAKDWLWFIYNYRSGVLKDDRAPAKPETPGFNAGSFLNTLAGAVAAAWRPSVTPGGFGEDVGSFGDVALMQRIRLMSLDAS
jgi:hypothetical protein